MTKEEFKDGIVAIEMDCDQRKRALGIKYANENNPYKVGDIVTDHVGSIVIGSIKYSLYDEPCVLYYGVVLNKDGKPNKLGKRRCVWQSNLID